MDPRASWERAHLLVSQRRWALAEEELRRLLGVAPDLGPAHSLLAIALGAQGRLDEALASARTGVGLDPEDPRAHHMLAAVLVDRDDLDAAAAAAQRCVELAPDDAAGHGLLAQVRMRQRRWAEALVAADAGLAADPEDVDCLNLRSMALLQLGRKDEAVDTMDAALARDPDNPETHQARGYALLHQGDAKGALHHFQESLRRDPSLDGARAGLVEALKARNPIYRLLLSWMLWLGRFSQGRQQQILFGAWALAFVGRRALNAAGYLDAAWMAGYAWLGIVLFTACTVPIFNLLLLLHPIGRHALDRASRRDALLLGGALVLLLTAVGLDQADRWIWADAAVFFTLLYLLPVAGLGLFEGGWARRVLEVFCVGVLLWFVAQAWWLEGMVDAARVDPGAGTGSLHARVPQADLERIGAFVGERMFLPALTAAISSWFVLLAPKGTRRRRRGAG
ncbi:MAG: tetratricopeptide repeat protein [Planctomycetota bacterium]